MSVTWGLQGSSPFADFGDTPLTDRLYNYLRAKWTLTGMLAQANFSTTNRLNPGTAKPWMWVQHINTDSARAKEDSTIGSRGVIKHLTVLRIHFFMKRPRDATTYPEFDRMVQEAERIIYQYYTDPSILGVYELDHFVVGEAVESSRDFGRSFQGVFRVSCDVEAHYHKISTA